MNKILWDLFKKTGDIKYYIMVKRLEGEDVETRKDRGNSSK